jgi:hypothetical protein
MTSTTPPISAAAEQDHHQYDNQDQFHGISPLMVAALFFRHLSNQRPPHRIVPIAALWDSEQTSRSRAISHPGFNMNVVDPATGRLICRRKIAYALL